VVEVAYFEAPPEGCEVTGRRLSQEAPLSMLVPLWVAAGATIWFGIHTEWSAGVAARAAAVLLEVAS
jgi:multicomponent Na+:H+ antiporter subunit D